jgi:thiamine-phosphate pyrophosphorylase
VGRVESCRISQQAISGLYAITPDETDTAELLRKLRLALLGGARVLQYRNKAADAALRLEQASALRKLTREFSVPLIINDDAILAQQVDADGVHLGGEDGSVAAARAALGSGKLIGISCYNRVALALEAVQQGADYVAFGSFFASTVKPGAVAASPDLLRQARREIAVPLVAIGGITVQNGAQLLEAGADALAVISAVFSVTDIQNAARQFSNLNFS